MSQKGDSYRLRQHYDEILHNICQHNNTDDDNDESDDNLDAGDATAVASNRWTVKIKTSSDHRAPYALNIEHARHVHQKLSLTRQLIIRFQARS